MAKSKTKDLRTFYGNLLGEDLVAKLSDNQVKIISAYYENLSEEEKDKINDAISEDKSHELLEMAQGFVQESEEDIKPKPKKRKTKVKKTEDKSGEDPPSGGGGTTKAGGGGNKPAAIVKYEGTNDEDLVDEEIDERILRLLGIDDAIGFDYGDYKTLLRERLMSARMGDSKIPVEEDELIREEFKRVKSKAGRFKVRAKKVAPEKFIPKALFTEPKERYLLANKISSVGGQEEDKKDLKLEEKSSLLEQVIEIKKSVDNILSLLSRQNTTIKKQSEGERLDKERRSKRKKEDSLEKIKTSAKGLVKDIISPVQGILDKIINFFVWVILGRAVTKFLEWAKDPQNKSKVEALGNLLKTFWPAILGAFVLFTTPLGKFIRVVVGTITKFTFQLLRKGIPALTRFLKNRNKNRDRVTDDSRRRNRRGGKPRVTEGAGDRLASKKPSRFGGARGGLLGGLALTGLAMATPFLSEKVGELYSNLKIGDAGLSDEDLLKEYQREKSNIDRKTSGPFGDLLSQRTDYSRLDGLEEELTRRGIAYRGGGEIFSGVVTKNDGIKFSGAGSDTQAFPVEGGGVAVLKPRELVLNEEQQKQLQLDTGVDPKSYVADARPRSVSGKITGYNSGGVIGGIPQGPFTPLPSPGYVRPQGSFIPKPVLALPGPMPGTTIPFGFNPLKGLKGGGNINRNSKKNQGMRLGASLINIGPIDTELPRPMTGFRDLAEIQYQNDRNRKVKGLRGGGIIENLQSFAGGLGNLFSGQKAKATASKPKVPSWYGPAPIQDYETPQAKALLKTIRTAEHYKGKDPYTSIYGGGSAPITKMTVQEVINMGNTGKLPQRFGGQSAGYASGSAATGAYQFMPFTLNDLIRKGLAKPNEIMTPKVQDRLGWGLASNRGVTLSSLKRGGLSQSIMDKMAPEWASFPYSPKGGLSYYDQPVKGSKFLSEIYQQSLPKKKAGGGDLTSEGLEKTYMQGQKSGMSSEVLKAIGDEAFLLKHFGGVWRNFKGSGASNMRGEPLPRKQGGGSIIPVTTNFGIDIPGGKMGADTQYWPQEHVALQPGEEIFKYVITKDSAEKGLGERLLSFADQQQKLLDSNSTASNIVKSVNRNIPGPRKSKSNGSQVLPPIEQRMGSKMMPRETNGSEVPPFPIISSYSKRSDQMSIYGIL